MTTASNEMEESSGKEELDHIEVVPEKKSNGGTTRSEEVLQEEQRVKLGWRSWMVVFVTCFANMVQIFVVTAVGQVIAFIIRDLGDASLAGWIIQAPLLLQAILAPIFGRLSDVVDRKSLVTITPIFAFVGAIISARAQTMNVLIAGSVLIGIPLGTGGIVIAIPAEVVPNKYRAVASGLSFISGATGALIGSLGAGAVTNIDPTGWRNIFWIQAAFHAVTILGLLLFYHPRRTSNYLKMTVKDILWACDPIGSGLFMSGTTLTLLALDWTGGAYSWDSAHVVTPLTLGVILLIGFGLYEWKGRSDGIAAHVFFANNWNFTISIFAFTVEGWIFYSAVNSITSQLVLNLGFENDSWAIAVRQMSYNVTAPLACLPMMWYSTKTKDLKYPLMFSYTIFLAVCICYATITPAFNRAQIGYNVLMALGQCGPLTVLISLFQLTAPHKYLSTATGIALSFRAIGGAFGSAVLDAIINGHLSSSYDTTINSTAIAAGLPASSVPALLKGLAAGSLVSVPGINPTIVGEVLSSSHEVYAKAYRLAWASIIPFVVIAIVAIAFLRGVKDLMNDRIEAPVEKVPGDVEVR